MTQATLKVVGAFLGLSYDRAYARRYPAIDPLESWTKYRGVIDPKKMVEAHGVLSRGNEVKQMMTVVGEEGTPIDDFAMMLKSEMFDNCYLQQNAYDEVDTATSAERQRFVFDKLLSAMAKDFNFDNKVEARETLVDLQDLFKNWNYVAEGTPEYDEFVTKIDDVLR